jgi:hypothetical protein
LNTNNTVIDTAELHNVRSYIFIPCIVYGEGEGFGNRISIQTTAVVQAAKKLRAVYDVNIGEAVSTSIRKIRMRILNILYQIWPVCHISDTTTAYIELLRSILENKDPEHGKNGYYLASSGSVTWADIYTAMAKSLAKCNVVDDEIVRKADDVVLLKMGQALRCPKELVVVQVGGM